MAAQTFDTVEELVDALSGGDSFAARVKQRLRANQVVTKLQAMRDAKGIPRSRIAQELGCSPRRIANIENSNDASLKFAELEGYANALDCAVQIDFAQRESIVAEMPNLST